jgi:ribose/xylose/arabinose/galactoside ABC-type transport system permease subunit
MTTKNNFPASINFNSLSKRMAIGGALALLLIIIFLYPTEPNPLWGKYWMIRPLIIVPLAGATGGACNYFLVNFKNLPKIVTYTLSFIVYVFGLWIGTVLGLAGTLWN